ncbi:MAG: hypothetical protein ACFFA3_07250 [Promethearchaeota archaeon]
MFRSSLYLSQIGIELGLSKKELKSLSQYGEFKHPFLYGILIILSICVIVVLILLGIYIERSTYATGSYYSNVKRKDFKRRKII